MRLIRALPVVLVLAVGCSGKGTQPASLSAATVRSATLDDSTVVVRRVAVDSGTFIYQAGTATRDGRYFSGLDGKTGNLAVRDMRTGERRVLTRSGDWMRYAYLVRSLISPDGQTLAFVWSVGRPGFGYELRTIGIDGSQERTLVRPQDPSEYIEPTDWSPDGRRLLAILYPKDKSHQMVLVSVSDGSVRTLKSLDWRSPQGLKFSPDGRSVAYDFQPSQESGARDLFVLQVDGSRETKITNDGVPKSLVGWSPDGLGLYYATKKDDATTIWYLPLQGARVAGAARVIRSDIWGASPIGLVGTSFYYSVSDAKQTVYSVAIDVGAARISAPPTPLLSGTDIVAPTIWSPDGSQLAFGRRLQTAGPNHTAIAIRSLSTGEEHQIPVTLDNASVQEWLPDSRALVVVGARRGQSLRYHLDLATGKSELIEQEAPIWEMHARSPDGRTEYSLHAKSSMDSSWIIARSVGTNQEREIYRGGGVGAFRVSPDGRSLALIVFDLHRGTPTAMKVTVKLVVVPAAGGEPRVLHSPDRGVIGSSSLNWTPDSRHLLFRVAGQDKSGGFNELWQASLPTSEAHQLLSVPMVFDMPVLSPDGRRVVYVATTGGRSKEVWVMENLPGSAKKVPSGAR